MNADTRQAFAGGPSPPPPPVRNPSRRRLRHVLLLRMSNSDFNSNKWPRSVITQIRAWADHYLPQMPPFPRVSVCPGAPGTTAEQEALLSRRAPDLSNQSAARTRTRPSQEPPQGRPSVATRVRGYAGVHVGVGGAAGNR